MNKYLRIITDLFPKGLKRKVNKRQIALNVRRYLFVFLVILVGILLQLLVILNSVYVEKRGEYAQRKEEYLYWVGVASQFPNIPDVLYNAALSAFLVGNRDDARHYIEKAIKIDPLFEKAYQLREEIE